MNRKPIGLLILLCALMCVISVSAYMFGVTVTLESTTPVAEQIEMLKGYIAQLPQRQQDEWFRELDMLSADRKTVYSLMALDAGADTVYITESGQKYHRTNSCSGLRNSKSISAVTKEVAVEMGRTPCKICYSHGD